LDRIIVIGIAWWKVLIGFFIMHYTAGLILSIVLLARCQETDNPSQTIGEMDIPGQFTNYLTNFAPKNKIVNWYTVV
jgi:linoleoyl-CoA desaturase